MDLNAWRWAEAQVRLGTPAALNSNYLRANSVQDHIRATCAGPEGRPLTDHVLLSGREPYRSHQFCHGDPGPAGEFLGAERGFDFDWMLWAAQLP
eukprot:9370017-Alexandrium_andersonii.AAC.1